MIERAFSSDQCALLRDALPQLPVQRGELGQMGEERETRRSSIRWLRPRDGEHAWVYTRVEELAAEANGLFKYKGLARPEDIQLGVYSGDEQGYYNWHADASQTDGWRALSVSVQLSEPADYHGGDLQVGRAPPLSHELGAAAVFPSWALHRVSPVLRGQRVSLVAWIASAGKKQPRFWQDAENSYSALAAGPSDDQQGQPADSGSFSARSRFSGLSFAS